MRYADIFAVICAALTTSCAQPLVAQKYQRMEPITLSSSPSCCSSPAQLAHQPVVLPRYGDSYLSPSVAESIPLVVAASELVPLPAGPAGRQVSAEFATPAIAQTGPAPVALPAPSVQVLRPVTGPSVPEGYVVGRGLIGQPKLYKPGQPVRNLLRYLSL